MQEILDKYGINIDYNLILSMWNESHRHYHNQNHLIEIIDKINDIKSSFTEKEYEKMIITALFHDIIYDPSKHNNEEKSADFLLKSCIDDKNEDIQEIKQMILDTKDHNPKTKLSKVFCDIDMSIIEEKFERLLEWENGIRLEYEPIYGYESYKVGRTKFLEDMLDKYPKNSKNLLKLIDFIKSSTNN